MAWKSTFWDDVLKMLEKAKEEEKEKKKEEIDLLTYSLRSNDFEDIESTDETIRLDGKYPYVHIGIFIKSISGKSNFKNNLMKKTACI